MQYVFKCTDCGKEFSVFGGIGTIFLSDQFCPVCRSKKIRRIWHSTPFVMKKNNEE